MTSTAAVTGNAEGNNQVKAPAPPGPDRLIRRVQVATVYHWRQAIEGVGVLALLALPDNAEEMTARAFALPPELSWLVRRALIDRLQLSIMRMTDRGAGKDGIPGLLHILDNEKVRSAVLAPGGDAHLNDARNKWAQIAADHRFKVLRDRRNYVQAHLITDKWSDQSGEGINLTACAWAVFEVVEALMLAREPRTRPLASYSDHWKELSAGYWARLTRDVEVSSFFGTQSSVAGPPPAQ